VGEKVVFPGRYEGSNVGWKVGESVGRVDGTGVDLPGTKDGSKLGEHVGALDGEAVGTGVDFPDM